MYYTYWKTCYYRQNQLQTCPEKHSSSLTRLPPVDLHQAQSSQPPISNGNSTQQGSTPTPVLLPFLHAWGSYPVWKRYRGKKLEASHYVIFSKANASDSIHIEQTRCMHGGREDSNKSSSITGVKQHKALLPFVIKERNTSLPNWFNSKIGKQRPSPMHKKSYLDFLLRKKFISSILGLSFTHKQSFCFSAGRISA